MIPERLLAQVVSLRVQTLLAHVNRNVLNLAVKLLDMDLYLLQMHFSVLVDSFQLNEHAMHVAFQRSVLVDLAVTELLDRLVGDPSFALANRTDRLECLENLRWRPLNSGKERR